MSIPQSHFSADATLLEPGILPQNFQRSSLVPNPDDGIRLRNLGKPLGATFIGIAILVLAIGFHRYFEAQYWVIRGKFPASRGSVALITIVAGSLMVTSLIIILAISRGGLA
jgi:hypothetical protein